MDIFSFVWHKHDITYFPKRESFLRKIVFRGVLQFMECAILPKNKKRTRPKDVSIPWMYDNQWVSSQALTLVFARRRISSVG